MIPSILGPRGGGVILETFRIIHLHAICFPPKNNKNVKYHEYCKEVFFKENNILLTKGLMFRIDKKISEFS